MFVRHSENQHVNIMTGRMHQKTGLTMTDPVCSHGILETNIWLLTEFSHYLSLQNSNRTLLVVFPLVQHV